MHAGDALWFLTAEVTMLERRYASEASTLELVGKMKEQIKVLGEFIGVEPPSEDKKQQLIQAIASTLSPPSDPPPNHAPAQRQSSGGGARANFSDPERIEAAKKILDEMVASGEFEWADMVSDMHSKVNGPSPFITDKQFRAIVNIGEKGEDGEFWERLSTDYPDAVRIAEEARNNA